jgi:hypothetical protein
MNNTILITALVSFLFGIVISLLYRFNKKNLDIPTEKKKGLEEDFMHLMLMVLLFVVFGAGFLAGWVYWTK